MLNIYSPWNIKYLTNESIANFAKFIKEPNVFPTKYTKEDLILYIMLNEKSDATPKSEVGAQQQLLEKTDEQNMVNTFQKPKSSLGIRRGGSMANLFPAKNLIVNPSQTTHEVTYKDINEISKNIFIEKSQRKWIVREKIIENELNKRPGTVELSKRTNTIADDESPLIDMKTIQTQTNYFKKIGMYDDYKKQRASFNQNQLQKMYKTRISSSSVKSRRKLASKPKKEDKQTNILKFKSSLPESEFGNQNPEKYTNVLKQYILSNRDIANELIQIHSQSNDNPRGLAVSRFATISKRKVPKIPKSILSEKIDMHIKKKQLLLEKLMLDRAHVRNSLNQKV